MKGPWHAETLPLAFGWRRGLAYALLWATAIGALETVLPASTVNPGEWALRALQAVPESVEVDAAGIARLLRSGVEVQSG